MIETTPFTANIRKFSGTGSQEVADCVAEEAASGFQIKSHTDRRLSGYHLQEEVVKMNVVNESGEVVEEEIERTSPVPFSICLHENIIEIYSNQTNTSELISELTKAAGPEFTISESPLQLKSVYEKLTENGLMTDLGSLRISNFEAKEDLSGTFTAKNVLYENATKLMDGRENEITVMRGTVKSADIEGKVGFFRSGSIRIYSHLDEELQFWNAIMDKVMEAYL